MKNINDFTFYSFPIFELWPIRIFPTASHDNAPAVVLFIIIYCTDALLRVCYACLTTITAANVYIPQRKTRNAYYPHKRP